MNVFFMTHLNEAHPHQILITPLSSFTRRLGRIPIDQFRETTLITGLGFFLIKKSQVVFFKACKEFVPADGFQCLFSGVARIIDPQNARATLFVGLSNFRGMAAASFDPSSYLVVIRRYFCL